MIFNSTIHHFPVDGSANESVFDWNAAGGDWPQYAPLYMTALQTSRQILNLPMDLFGNVKIPDVTRLEDFQSISPTNATLYNNLDRIHSATDVPKNLKSALDGMTSITMNQEYIPRSWVSL
jgi:hypothetical protein